MVSKNVVPIVYSKGYNITACGFEKAHPFDSTKYRRIWDFLQENENMNMVGIKCYHDIELPSRRWLLEVMTMKYLAL